MPDPSSDATSDWVDNPYQSPVAPLDTTSRTSLLHPLRGSFLGAAIGGCLGLVLDSIAMILLYMSAKEPEDAEVGPMFVAMLPFLAVGVIVACAMIGLLLGLLLGSIRCVMARPSQRTG
ncbi:hypothetical protein SAMN05444166_4842 [Singulisphaera sp. GP187]|uniref:hypothetical protein n=1 Tax=Singulisphaera sp. GP187 TaxID=1882752 RepID=UPI0009260F5E|nr:hypothetical protein [Singulisphaera sp. GP187]SIO45190.1 hypothetical protein SAMN05444166_4842 [Singulisphaera sp. GP187]